MGRREEQAARRALEQQGEDEVIEISRDGRIQTSGSSVLPSGERKIKVEDEIGEYSSALIGPNERGLNRWYVENAKIREYFPQFRLFAQDNRIVSCKGRLRTNWERIYNINIKIPRNYPYEMPRVFVDGIEYDMTNLIKEWNTEAHTVAFIIYRLEEFLNNKPESLGRPNDNDVNKAEKLKDNNIVKDSKLVSMQGEGLSLSEMIKATHIKIILPTEVVKKIYELYEDYPSVENGGRIIGIYDNIENGIPKVIRVYTIIPPGPRAKRTPVSLFQDGEWQDWIFRKLELIEPNLHYVGSFHHHCSNRLSHLSSGDIEGYQYLLKKYKPKSKVFLAVLMYKAPSNSDILKYPIVPVELAKNFIDNCCNLYFVTPDAVFNIKQLNVSIDFETNTQVQVQDISNTVNKLKDTDMPSYLRQDFLKTKFNRLQNKLEGLHIPFKIILNKKNDDLKVVLDNLSKITFRRELNKDEIVTLNFPLYNTNNSYKEALKWIIQEF